MSIDLISYVRTYALSDNTFLAVRDSGFVDLWDSANNTILKTIKLLRNPAPTDCSPSGGFATSDLDILYYTPNVRNLPYEKVGQHTLLIEEICYLSENRLASSCARCIQIWDLTQKVSLHQLIFTTTVPTGIVPLTQNRIFVWRNTFLGVWELEQQPKYTQLAILPEDSEHAQTGICIRLSRDRVKLISPSGTTKTISLVQPPLQEQPSNIPPPANVFCTMGKIMNRTKIL